MSEPSIYERLIAGKKRMIERSVLSPYELSIFLPLYDAVLPFHRPPTENEVDASLTRLGDADSATMDVAAAAVRYVKLREQWGVRSLDDRDFADQLDAAYHEMKDATERFEEAMV